jgi:hypothetical protein
MQCFLSAGRSANVRTVFPTFMVFVQTGLFHDGNPIAKVDSIHSASVLVSILDSSSRLQQA